MKKKMFIFALACIVFIAIQVCFAQFVTPPKEFRRSFHKKLVAGDNITITFNGNDIVNLTIPAETEAMADLGFIVVEIQ